MNEEMKFIVGGEQAWNQREYKTLLIIKDYLVNE